LCYLSVPKESRPVWPPTREDLQRLYVEQKLSAMKIAKVYGLCYASEKTAESTVLYHLRMNGIARRDPAAHVRKVTDAMVDEWVARYEKGESLKQIAGDVVEAATVFNRLHKRGVQLRDKVEAQIKAVTIHERRPFTGSMAEKLYLCGLAAGDFGVVRHGRSVRARLGTTHPAMSTLFKMLLGRFGPVYEYPKLDHLSGYEWSLDCDLDETFEFLFAAKRAPLSLLADETSFLAFLAGFFDAEGSIYYHAKNERGSFELSIANKDFALLQGIGIWLDKLGIVHVLRSVSVDRERAIESGIANPNERMWRIVIWRFTDVQRLLSRMELKHPEKMAKAEIALRLPYRASRTVRKTVLEEWNSLCNKLDLECREYIEQARLEYEKKSRNRDNNLKPALFSDSSVK